MSTITYDLHFYFPGRPGPRQLAGSYPTLRELVAGYKRLTRQQPSAVALVRRRDGARLTLREQEIVDLFSARAAYARQIARQRAITAAKRADDDRQTAKSVRAKKRA